MKKRNLMYYYDHAEEIILFSITAVMVIVIFWQVVMRYVFNDSLSWSEELGRYIFIWMSWIGVSMGAREGQHIKIDMITDRLSFKIRHITYILADVIVLVICLIITYYGVYLVDQLLSINARSAPLHISQAWGYAAVPVGCGLMIMRSIQSIWRSIKNIRSGKEVVRNIEAGVN